MLKKNFIPILVIVILVVCIGAFIYMNMANEDSVIDNSFQEFSYKCDGVEELKKNLEDINSNIGNLGYSDNVMKVGEEIVNKGDIEEIELINEAKDSKEDPIISAAKQAVAIQEAKKIGFEISDESRNVYKSVAEEMYENSEESLTKEEYVNKWIRIQENEEIASLFMGEIIKQISLKEFTCEDETVNKKVEEFYNDVTLNNLQEAYDAYLTYLLLQYTILW